MDITENGITNLCQSKWQNGKITIVILPNNAKLVQPALLYYFQGIQRNGINWHPPTRMKIRWGAKNHQFFVSTMIGSTSTCLPCKLPFLQCQRHFLLATSECFTLKSSQNNIWRFLKWVPQNGGLMENPIVRNGWWLGVHPFKGHLSFFS